MSDRGKNRTECNGFSDRFKMVADGGDIQIENAVETLSEGGLVIYPTETVYGIGADALNPKAVEKVFEAKDRNFSKPVSLAVSSSAEIESYAYLDEDAECFVEKFLPGPITVVLGKRDNVPNVLTGGRERVGIRVPDHPAPRKLAQNFGPVTSTSANISGNPSAETVEELDSIENEAELVIRTEPGEYVSGSTVVDAVDWKVLREGPQETEAEVRRWIENNVE
ncbi:MAG: L-threonylcarbamoyladenylate synthase [Halobacteria archaeon]